MSFPWKEVALGMIPDSCIEVHTTPLDRPSVPVGFAEVIILARHLATTGLLEAFADQVHLDEGASVPTNPLIFSLCWWAMPSAENGRSPTSLNVSLLLRPRSWRCLDAEVFLIAPV